MGFIVGAIKRIMRGVVIVVGLMGIFGMIVFSIFKLQEINSSIAILSSTLVSCLLMIPVISSFNYLVDSKIGGKIINAGKKFAAQTAEIAALNDSINLLKNAQISVQSFHEIAELALLETHLQQTSVRQDKINESQEGFGIQADSYYDELLVIITHDITAKFGVNLNAIKLFKIDKDTVVVSGIKSTFIGASKNVTHTHVKEIRRIKIKNDVKTVTVQNKQLQLADRKAEEFEVEFQTKLSEGNGLGFMDDAVIQLAQNFIKVILAPLYKNIQFDDMENERALPFNAYLQKEAEINNNRRIELTNTNEKLLLVNLEREEELVST